jgi:NAD(P)-dependent dehydrogenase (short-subunit alcohol dehydrogenase family)
VTGGTGALGQAIVRRFSSDGDRVIVPWILKHERDQVEAEFRAANVVLIEADIAEEAGARAVVAAAPGLEVLVNAAGGFGFGGPVADTELELWDRMYRMNLRTAASMCRAAAPELRERDRATIVCIAAQAALGAAPQIAAYAASKAGIVALVRALQEELAPNSVNVHAVVPTTIDTPANRTSMPDADFTTWTPPARIAEVIHWLASSQAQTVRGALLPV